MQIEQIIEENANDCAFCKNKSMHGIDVGKIKKNFITCNKKHMELKDK